MHNETAMHLLCCNHKTAEEDRQEDLQKFIKTVQEMNGPAPVLQIFTEKLSKTLHITQKFQLVQDNKNESTPTQDRALQKAVLLGCLLNCEC
jgi:hypothetical protein